MMLRGTVAECLKHYGKTLPSGRGRVKEGRRPLASFVKTPNLKLINTWTVRQDRGLPTGMNLVRVMVFLTELGYSLVEMERLEKYQRQALFLLAYDIVSMEKMAVLLGQKAQEAYASGEVYRIVFGKIGTGEANKARVEQAAARHERSLKLHSAAWKIHLAEHRHRVEKLGISASSLQALPKTSPRSEKEVAQLVKATLRRLGEALIELSV